MLVDEVQITVQAGTGGDGKVSFHREKFNPKGGPDGGSGGKGGDVYFVGVNDISAMQKFRYDKEFKAGDGRPGDKNRKTGESGKDLEIEIPVGTVIYDLGGVEKWEMRKEGKRILIAKGGEGGRGNWHFRSPVNQNPKEFEYGLYGQKKNLFLELQLIADIGLVGLPNAGKSSLLNELTKANVKVASYPFTTLEPNLGAMDGIIIADLPGLIEGAHEGKGLGIKFLKHVKRTKVLLHCISSDSENVTKDYETIRKELGEYDKELLERPEIILITKSDLASRGKVEDIKARLLSRLRSGFGLRLDGVSLRPDGVGEAGEILDCSIHDWESLENLRKQLLYC